MNDLTSDEIAALTAELRPHRGLRAALGNHREFFSGVACGFVFGVVALISAFDVWLYLWN